MTSDHFVEDGDESHPIRGGEVDDSGGSGRVQDATSIVAAVCAGDGLIRIDIRPGEASMCRPDRTGQIANA